MRQLIWDGVRENDEVKKLKVWRASRIAMDIWFQQEHMVCSSSAMIGCTRLAFRPGWLVFIEYVPVESEHTYAKPWYVTNEDGVYVARVLTDEYGQID